VPGVLTYVPTAGTVLNAGAAQPLSVTFQPNDAVNYNGASAANTLTVEKATASVTLAGLARTYDGEPKPVLVSTVPANLQVDVTYDGSATAPSLPGNYAVAVTVRDGNYIGSAAGTLVISAAAQANHAPSIQGGIDGSLQVMSAEDISLQGSSWIAGDLLVRGSPDVVLKGNPTYGGTVDGVGDAAPTDYRVTLNGSGVIGRVVRRINPCTLAPVAPPAAPTGTRDVALNNANQSGANLANLRSLTLNGNVGTVALPPGIYGDLVVNGANTLVLGDSTASAPAVYQLQNLALNGPARLECVGPVIVVLANGTALSGTIGNAAHPEWLTLNLAAGGLTINAGAELHGRVVAPVGTVAIDGTLRGNVVADRLTISAAGLFAQP
jgi:cytoskeletal protein CcmA (bactofilin family)